MLVPHQQLSEAALAGLLRDFVTRDGTDYGEREASLEQKMADVLRQLERREAAVDFDPQTQSVTIIVLPRPGIS